MSPRNSYHDEPTRAQYHDLVRALRCAHEVRITLAGVILDEFSHNERRIGPRNWDDAATGWDGTPDGLETLGFPKAAEAMRKETVECAP